MDNLKINISCAQQAEKIIRNKNKDAQNIITKIEDMLDASGHFYHDIEYELLKLRIICKHLE